MRNDNKIPALKAVVTGNQSVIHNVHILDASGSMGGWGQVTKYGNALKGINSEIMEMKKDGEGMTQTIIEFDSGNSSELRLSTHYFMTPAASCTAIVGVGARGGTPLYQTVGETIEKLLSHVKQGEKVLIKIFTDGDENTSQGKYRNHNELKSLIKLVEDNHNFTVTFMGTQQDIDTVVKSVGINVSNTLMHMNTADSIGATYKLASTATQKYRKEVASGASTEELKGNFFKRVAEDKQGKNIGIAKEEKTTN